MRLKQEHNFQFYVRQARQDTELVGHDPTNICTCGSEAMRRVPHEFPIFWCARIVGLRGHQVQ
jgi:hypothetical protein